MCITRSNKVKYCFIYQDFFICSVEFKRGKRVDKKRWSGCFNFCKALNQQIECLHQHSLDLLNHWPTDISFSERNVLLFWCHSWFSPLLDPSMGQSVPILVWRENSIFEEAPLYTFRMREMATTTNMEDC